MSSKQAQLAAISHFRATQQFASVAAFVGAGLFGATGGQAVQATDEASMTELLAATGFVQFGDFPQLSNQEPLYIEYLKGKTFNHEKSQVNFQLSLNGAKVPWTTCTRQPESANKVRICPDFLSFA